MWYTTINAKHNVFKQGVHYMTSPFGERIINGKKEFHNGIDVIGNGWACDYIVAFADGKVIDMLNTCSGNFPATGNYVVIEHGFGKRSVYYHLAKGSVVVNLGQNVKAGDVLGYMGTTGNSTGNHLHFGIMINGVWVDPLPYLKGEKNMLRFTDVPETHWAYKAIESLADMGIINGYEDGTFKPDEAVTRAELATMLDRYISKKK